MFDRSTLLRAAVIALGSALTVPALADTDMIPITGSRAGAASGEATNRAGSVAPTGNPTGNPGYFVNEPSAVAGARGASGAYVSRTPLASAAPNVRATDAYGAALSEASN